VVLHIRNPELEMVFETKKLRVRIFGWQAFMMARVKGVYYTNGG
jgi:hypothetical protein